MKKYLKSIFYIALILVTLLPCNIFATSTLKNLDVDSLDLSSIDEFKANSLKEAITNLNLDENPTDDSTTNAIISTYESLSEVISNEEMADIIDANKNILVKAGVNKSLLSTSSTFLRTFDPEVAIDVIQNDLDLDTIVEDSKGSSRIDLFISAMKNTDTSTKIKATFKILFSNNYFKLLFALFFVIMIYSIIVTGFIFKKADKSGFATFIPIYRDIIHLKMCNFSPWVLILVFIPIIGWLALLSIAVIGRFELAKNFRHGALFGFGLLFLPFIFRSYLAFSNDKFIE